MFARDGGYTFVSSAELPGFSFVFTPEEDSVEKMLAAIHPALDTYIAALMRYEEKKQRESQEGRNFKTWFSAFDLSALFSTGNASLTANICSDAA